MKLGLMQASQIDKFDNLMTPEYAIMPILKYIPKTPQIIWEPFDPGTSNFTKLLKLLGHTVISTDIRTTKFNFLTDVPDFDFTMILSNPPYSVKNKVLEKTFEYRKPFGYLLPITTLEGKFRGKLFKQYGIEVLVLPYRCDFSGGGANWFNTSYFCWKLLPDKLIFEEVPEE